MQGKRVETALKIGLLCSLMFISCTKDDLLPQADNYIIIVNTISETLSFYDLDRDSLFEDFLTTGRTPNDLFMLENIGIIVNSGFQGMATLDMIDLPSRSLISRKYLPTGSNPYSICYLNHRYYVTLSAYNKVYALSENFLPVDSIPVGKWPEGICAFENKIFVATTGFDIQNYTYGQGHIYVIDTNTSPTKVDSIEVSTNPQMVKVVDGSIWIMCTGDYGNTGGKFYRMDPATLTLEDSISAELYPSDFIIYHGKILFTDLVNGIFSLTPEGEIDTIMATIGPSRIILDGNRSLVSLFSATSLNYILYIDPERGEIIHTIPVGQAKGVGPIGVYRR
ncbi:MAG TPA: hypothetical protein PKU94_01980 [Candidatus Hydrothermia bacterium]|nr:hypothetical protein [Candidatus Hydrothermae bacterium]MDD3649082.1 hypothetical protein [Candidatus Hydrothermia bacterium]MDD5572865.1 hypothetical protein [Candidatus Hydrothermia bacterium]HOK23021.1 hypothetical protein [Candidatus Hydrothermia bacterium]HOL23719.1 hypothetical protein [Candidatus Hydrothermia bacterium]